MSNLYQVHIIALTALIRALATKSRSPALEASIRKCPMASVTYASHVLMDRWIDAEPDILLSPMAAYYYARDVIKGPWAEACQVIQEDPEAWGLYVREVIG